MAIQDAMAAVFAAGHRLPSTRATDPPERAGRGGRGTPAVAAGDFEGRLARLLPPSVGRTGEGEAAPRTPPGSGTAARAFPAAVRPGPVREPGAEPAERVHRVRRGDTLWDLARRYGTTVGAIARANGLADPDRILAGSRLRIPSGTSEARRPAPAGGLEPVIDVRSGSRRTTVWRYRVQPGDTLFGLSVRHFHVPVEEIARQNGIRDPDRIHPGQLLEVTRTAFVGPREVVASWYGPGFDGRPMADGSPYDRHAATIAHRTLPLGTRVRLTNPETGVSVEARVADRGPFVAGREVDLSYGLARRLDLVERGVGRLLLQVEG